jgi:hypothetical protein
MSGLPVLKVPSLDEFKSKLQHDEKKEPAPVAEMKRENKLVIAYSKEIPQDVKTLFSSLGRVVEFNYDVHSSLKLLAIDFNYMYVDITKEKNRLYLKLHRKELDQIHSIGYAHKFELETCQREDAWFNAMEKAISAFDTLIGSADEMEQALFQSKLKYQSKAVSVLKKCFSCVAGH